MAPNMSADPSPNSGEPVVRCPYCTSPVFRRFLYGHVSAADDEEHGPRGTVPDDFDEQTPTVIDRAPVRPERRDDPDGKRLICRYCLGTFDGRHGIEVHLGIKRGDEDHPEDVTVEDAAVEIVIPDTSEPAEAEDVGEEAPEEPQSSIADYRRRLKSMAEEPGTSVENPDATVPARPLLELLNELQERETNGRGYYDAAQLLQDVLEEHGVIAPR